MARNYYVDGNTVRKVEAPEIPVRDPRRERQIRKEEERERRAEATRNAAYRNRSRAKSLHLGHMAIYTGYVAAVLAAAFTLAQTQTSINHRMNNVAALESQIASLKADNDAREKELNASVDLNEIKDFAINELGMTYAAEDQIQYYTVDKSGYMDQYSSIPQ